MYNLDEVQFNILVASIIGDGEITKIYPNSRRINNSYREHYGTEQKDYRLWKQNFLPDLLYITPRSNTLRSKSCKLFTNWYSLFYDLNGNKQIPHELVKQCTLQHFLAILYMDDGSLVLSKRINHQKKNIFLTPHIYLYLQNYKPNDLDILKEHIQKYFNINLKKCKRNDGYGYILRTTSVKETFNFLEQIKEVTATCPSMYYKTNWDFRLKKEKDKYKQLYPNYNLLISSSNRSRTYSEEEIKLLIKLKKQNQTDQSIAESIGRSYWSVVYKLSELRKNGEI
ncbi:DNA endonuclease [Bacilli bacterium]|uniref:DNA endonuclease n=1 Tax=Oceanobacillus sp. FSL K6-0118 TaxID=2921418 RepID=UPI000621764D|nr:DNA endonuclease [Bacilli bacterium VT-13-104]PZD83068.1 DNA endonuclease [Bacilli bacterium]PZD86524.1 DNA endonuclease [Bacilli bacterium]PZD90043.1 DNA endonuclease [Bacilli bacterium]RCO04261.1 DNA endonuclease [Bacilli bacterium]